MTDRVIQRTVPSAWVPASFSICGASAAKSDGIRDRERGTDEPMWACTVSRAPDAIIR